MLPVAILAGGLATRLHPITEKMPKSLMKVNGEPFVLHQLRLLHGKGVRSVVLCVGHLGNMIQDVVGDGSAVNLKVDYSFDGDFPLGTGGAVRNALPKLGEAFFSLYGDSYLPCDYAAIAREFESAGVLAMMTVFRNEGRWDTSNVEFEAGRILAYNQKRRNSRMRHIDYGLGVFRAKAFRHLPSEGALDLGELYHDLLLRGELAGFEVAQRFYEIGSFAGLQETVSFLAQEATHK